MKKNQKNPAELKRIKQHGIQYSTSVRSLLPWEYLKQLKKSRSYLRQIEIQMLSKPIAYILKWI